MKRSGADAVPERCPFEEQDCLEARSLVETARHILEPAVVGKQIDFAKAGAWMRRLRLRRAGNRAPSGGGT